MPYAGGATLGPDDCVARVAPVFAEFGVAVAGVDATDDTVAAVLHDGADQ